MVVDQRTCLLARSSSPHAAEQKVGRVTVNECGQARSWGGHLCSAGDGFIVEFRAHRVCRVFLYLYCIEALRRCGKSARLHVFNLVFENQMNGLLVIDFVGEVHEDCVGADVRVLGRVYACEVLVFDEY